MVNRRQGIALRTKDKVSVVMYRVDAWTAVFNKSWADVLRCDGLSDNKFGGLHAYRD